MRRSDYHEIDSSPPASRQVKWPLYHFIRILMACVPSEAHRSMFADVESMVADAWENLRWGVALILEPRPAKTGATSHPQQRSSAWPNSQ